MSALPKKTKKSSKLHCFQWNTNDLFEHIYYWQISALVLGATAGPQFIATCEASKNQFVSPQASKPP